MSFCSRPLDPYYSTPGLPRYQRTDEENMRHQYDAAETGETVTEYWGVESPPYSIGTSARLLDYAWFTYACKLVWTASGR